MSKMGAQTEGFLPVWVWIIVVAQVLLVLFFSVGTALNPANFIPGVTELNYATQLYVARNVTVAIGLVVVLLLRTHQGLLALLIVRILTDIADVVSVYAFDVEVIKSSVPMVVFLLVLPALLAVGYLWKRLE